RISCNLLIIRFLIIIFIIFDLYQLFFFSSRRRHTSFSRDWSSDVCSSDLGYHWLAEQPVLHLPLRRNRARCPAVRSSKHWTCLQIGRASCRESVNLGSWCKYNN